MTRKIALIIQTYNLCLDPRFPRFKIGLMPLRSLFVDFNSYFASVEQQVRPELRGLPVAVVPVMTDSTCCIAASYEAKHFGVKTGTMVGDARRMCPRLRIVEARPSLYVTYHHRLIEVVDSVIPVVEVCSIDEMACALNGPHREREAAVAVAHEIKRRIAEKVGPWMKCSIGIAPNDFLAKTATDMQKPDGLVVIEDRDLPHCLHRLELRDFCGIGRAMETRLREHGLHTVKALCAATPDMLRRAWGSIEGERLHAKLRGEVVYSPPTRRSMVSHSQVLSPKLRKEAEAYSVLNRLLQKAAVRLRKLGCLAAGIGVSVRNVGGKRWRDEMRFQETQDTLCFLRALDTLWRRRPSDGPPPMKVGVYLFHLSEIGQCTAPLLPEGKSRPELNRLIDRLNERYGKNAVYFGEAHTALDAADMKIAFNRIPDQEFDGEEEDTDD